MKRNWIAALVWIFISLSCSAQPVAAPSGLASDWVVELEQSDIGQARTTLHFETKKETFEAFTRKNADKVIFGGWTSLLGRVFTKSFKNGSLLRLEQGIFRKEGDTVRLAAILTSALGSYNIEGYALKDSLFLTFRSGTTYKGHLRGRRGAMSLPMEDYGALFEKAIARTKNNIYNRSVLSEKSWTQFVAQMRKITPRLQDDLEMVFAFFYYARKLPFSHYALLKMPLTDTSETKISGKKRVFLEELNPQTGLLKITSFDGSVAEMDSVFATIQRKSYQNLIVDLRDNPGGSVAAGMSFATAVADTPFYGGIFLTQKYFDKHKTLPQVAEYDRFPHFTEANFDLILKGIHNEEGLCLKVVPVQNPFKGKLFFLTNSATASTCEPIVYGFQQRGRAVVVGQKTAGAMLNGEFFDLDKGFQLVIPTADYYAVDGFRIDQNSVVPNVETKPEAALQYVNEHLLK